MATPKHLKILKQGVDAWNAWRQKHPKIKINFQGADLSGADLRQANLSKVDLSGADLSDADLRGADLSDATLIMAHLKKAGTGSVSCNSVFVRYLGRFLNQEELMEHEATVQNP